MPGPFAAVILKAAACLVDSRDRDRHLFDAAALLACIEDPFAETEHLAGSESPGAASAHWWIRLPDSTPGWVPLDRVARSNAQAALRILGTT